MPMMPYSGHVSLRNIIRRLYLGFVTLNEQKRMHDWVTENVLYFRSFPSMLLCAYFVKVFMDKHRKERVWDSLFISIGGISSIVIDTIILTEL